MANTTFISKVTQIATAWLQDVNDFVYSLGVSKSSLAASSGAGLVGWIRAATGAVLYTLGEFLGWTRPNALEFMTIAQRIDVLAGTATLDVTTALQAAIDASPSMTWPRGTFLISNSLTVTTKSALNWEGDPNFTFVLNKASAGKPTFVFTDVQHAVIDGVSPIGHSSYVNDGFRFTTAGGQTCAFIHMKNVKMQPNGNGIELRKVNTMSFDECSYWQSGANGSGASASAGARAHAIFVDGTIAGNYANEIAINGGNLLDVDHTAAGHAAIKMTAGAGGSLQNITVDNVEMEGVGNIAIDINTASNVTVTKCFLENTTVNLTTCRYSEIADSYSLKYFNIVAGLNVLLRNTTVETGAMTIDATSENCGAVNSNLGAASTDVGINSVYLNCTANGGVLQADRLGAVGIKERNRTVAMGAWTTPTYAAGNYTASTGTWTVDAGDVTVYRYTLVGKTMYLDLYLDSTSVSATPANLFVAIPGGFTAANRVIQPIIVQDNSATKQIGAAYVTDGGTTIKLYSSANFGAWQTSTNNSSVFASLVLEIQ